MKKIHVILLAAALSSCSVFQKKEKQTPNSAIDEIIETEDEMTDIEIVEIPVVKIQNTKDTNQVFVVVEKMPEFPGGMDSLMSYLGRTIKYPKEAKDKGVKGKVFIQFIVRKTGKITDIKTIRGIGSGCDEEAENAVKNMPNWIPGEQRGKPVNVQFVLPVNFTLRDPEPEKN